MGNQLSGQVAVVTGGSRGIGLAISEKLLEQGLSVMICSREQSSVQKALDTLKQPNPGRIEGMAADVRHYEQVERLMAATGEKFGGIDILVNNAGIGLFSSVERMTPEEWDAVIGTNLSGTFYCVHAAVPYMKRRKGGTIINISSLAGKNAFPGGAAYNASKFGLNGFSEAVMQDLRYENIRTSYIMPGSVDTRFGGGGREAAWKTSAGDVAQVVLDLLRSDPRSMISRVEIRPSQPPRK